MAKRNTKEIILNTALQLFADRGYDGVGMREIASKAGVRESAIYKHYKNKQDIFDSIILKMDEVYEQETASFQIPQNIAAVMQGGEIQENLYKMCLLMFCIYLQDNSGSQLRRMLTIEQVKHTASGEIFKQRILDQALDYIAIQFSELIKQGYYQDYDPQVMALQFYSPLYLLLVKYDRQTERHEEALAFLEKHITIFDSLYRK